MIVWFARSRGTNRAAVVGAIVQQPEVLVFVVRAQTKAVVAGQVNEKIGPGSIPVRLLDQCKEALAEGFLQRAEVRVSHSVALATLRDQRFGLDAQLVVAAAVEVH